MNEIETKKKFWQQKWFPWVVVVLLTFVIGGLGWKFLSSQNEQKNLESEMQFQRETIEALRNELAQKEDEADRFIHEATPKITSSLVSDKLGSIQELVTTEYIYTNSGKYDNVNQATIIKWDVNIPFTQKSFIVAYDGRIKAGVDMSKAKIDINEDSRTITVTLPESEIISHETFEDTLVVLDEKNNVFNPISISDYNEFAAAQKTNMEQKAIDRGILTNAAVEAKVMVQSVVSLLPGIDTYKLVIK